MESTAYQIAAHVSRVKQRFVSLAGFGFLPFLLQASTFTSLGFFAFNKQAFCNYYFFVIGAMCCAIAACADQD